MAKKRYRFLATLIICYFLHGTIVQLSDRSRGSSIIDFSERSAHGYAAAPFHHGLPAHGAINRPLSSEWSSMSIPTSTSDTNTDNYRHILAMLETSNVTTRTQDLESLRFAAFGTSRTWGTGLQNPDTQAYIKLLSPSGANYGLRATGVDYPSICFHSMVGDDQVFDVIILEFTPAGGPYHSDFVRLAKRVRARFPSAIIVYLPIFWILHEVHHQNRQIIEHLTSRGIKSPSDPAFEEFIQDLPDSELRHVDRTTFHRLDRFRETLKAIGGHMIEFPPFEEGDLKKFLLENVKYIGNPSSPFDDNHPSILGHQRIAEMIRAVLLELPLPTSEVGEWLGGKDSCVSWFNSGKVGQGGEIDVSNMKMNQFAHESDKWAWEVADEGGTISVNCRDPPCDVFIGHMASTYRENYPRVHLEMNNETALVKPLIFADFPQNVNVITRVGTLQTAGKATVSVTPLPDHAFQPFRITGVLVAPSISVV